MPAACGDRAAAKAGFRFFDNPRVTQRTHPVKTADARIRRPCAPRCLDQA
ncbi:hypothetical protein, partial [Mesorhizobium sp. 98Argb]